MTAATPPRDPALRPSIRQRFSDLSPWAKLGLWLAVSVGASVLYQLIESALTGRPMVPLSGRSSNLLQSLSLLLLVGMAAYDRTTQSPSGGGAGVETEGGGEGGGQRGGADLGLAIDERWAFQLWGGFLLAVACYVGYVALARGLGAATIGGSIRGERWPNVLYLAPAAFFFAFVHQIVTAGYLYSLLRGAGRASRITAVLVPSVALALTQRIDVPLDIPARHATYFIGVVLSTMALIALRRWVGHVMLGGGVLAGWVAVESCNRALGVVRWTAGPDRWQWWLAPNRDLRQSPLVWAALLLATATLLLLPVRRSRAARKHAGIPPSLKRVYPLGMMSMMAPLDVWLARLWHARFRVGPIYLPRLICTLIFSAVATVVLLPERLIVPLLTRRRSVKPPLFIMGVHRSGTTHLHNLLALDDRFVVPRTCHVMAPTGSVLSAWLLLLPLAPFLPSRRPMDNMAFHLWTPQEEEFAMQNACSLSSYWAMCFPRQIPHYDRFIVPARLPVRQREAWKRAYLGFLRRLTLPEDKPPLLKSPHNTGRIATLLELFPEARFVHIHRHPLDVYRSNQHIEKHLHAMQQVQDPPPAGSGATYSERFLDNYLDMETEFYAHADRLPAGRCVEVGFEELEHDPMGVVRRVYAELGLTITPRFEARLTRYLAEIADYQKNPAKPLPPETTAMITQRMAGLMRRWGYAGE